MAVRQYQLGLKHGREGVRYMAHRLCRNYDSRRAQESYLQGYKKGSAERLTETGKTLDYSNPLNNQLFIDATGPRDMKGGPAKT